jgi:hypothetical protein
MPNPLPGFCKTLNSGLMSKSKKASKGMLLQDKANKKLPEDIQKGCLRQ